MTQRTLFLFDIDGTLTKPRQTIENHMIDFLKNLQHSVTIGVVGGSDLAKQKEQLGNETLSFMEYSFAENGLVAYQQGNLLGCTKLQEELGEQTLGELINWILSYLGALSLPVKRGTFIEFRTGMLNVSPIGRNCTTEERNAFEKYDQEKQIRKSMVNAMKTEFAHLSLSFSIGGQISFDVFPTGWDKTFCLHYIDPDEFEAIHFFGDKTEPGGNDYEIFTSPRVIGHHVCSPEDTQRQCMDLLHDLKK